MTTDPTRPAKDLFLEAIELTGEERELFLARLRDDEPELHRRVTRLLAADEQSREAMPELIGAVHDTLIAELRESGGRAGGRLGDYELLEEIASGASGVVFRARQVSLDRIVAVKVLRAGRFAETEEVERFRAEAEAVARLDDPQIVPIYEVGDSAAGPFFSMKWIEGGSLADVTESGAQDPRDAASTLIQVARAVHHAHQRGILHRDLKPSNILVDEARTPYVADFGVARRIDAEQDHRDSGWVAGTPAYMAPEQTTTEGEELSVATDVWALGVLLHELLGGRPAFSGASITETLDLVREREPAPLPSTVPRDLTTIVGKCLQKESARRYPSAHALAVDLERWLNFEPILARRTTTRERLVLWARRRPLVTSLLGLIGLLTIVLAVGASWAILRLSDQVQQITEAESEARVRLRTSLLAQARDRRRGRGVGRRTRALELIRQAAEIHPGPDLRDEAIACLAVFDVTIERDRELPARGSAVIAFDAELERSVTASAEGEIVIEHFDGGSEPLHLPGFGPLAWIAHFSPDGRRLAVKYHGASALDRPTFVLWDLETSEKLAVLPTFANAMEFRPGGASILVVGEAGEVSELDLETGELLREVELDENIYRASIGPFGEQLAVSRYPDRTITVYRWPELDVLYALEPGHTIFDFEWTHGGEALLYTSSDQHTHLIDVDTAEVTRVFTGHRSDVVQAMLSPDGARLVTLGWDRTSRLWDFVTGEELLTMEAKAMRFGSDGRLAFQDNDRVGIWHVDPDPIRRTLHGHGGKSPAEIDFAADGRLLVSAGGGEVILWDPIGARRLRTLEIEGVGAAFFHPDGRLITVSPRIGVQSWILPDSISTIESTGLRPERTLLAGDFAAAHFTPDGRILTALAGKRIHLARLDDPAETRVIEAFSGANRPEVDASGRWLVCGSWHSPGPKVRVWDLETGEVAIDLCPEAGSVRAHFTPDGELLVTGSGPLYRLFRTGSWEEVLTFERPITIGTGPNLFAFGPGGTIVIEDVDSAVRMHDLESGALIARFEPPEVVAPGPIAIDPTGRFLAVGSANNRIELWDVARVWERLREMGLGEGE